MVYTWTATNRRLSGVFANFSSADWAHIDDVIHRCATHGMMVVSNVTFVGINGGSGYSLNDVLAASDLSHLRARFGHNLSVLARTSAGQTMMAYIPNGNRTTVTINMAGITDSGGKAECWWTNPSTRANTFSGTFNNSETRTFTAPDSNDWVLTLDSNAANLCAPELVRPGPRRHGLGTQTDSIGRS